MQNERLFKVAPIFVERWVYIDSAPYIEKSDVVNEKYDLQQYCGM